MAELGGDFDDGIGQAVAGAPMDNVALALQNEPRIIVPQIEPTVPSYASFQLMNTGAMSGRNRTTQVPQAGQTYRGGDKVRIFFPRQYWTDLQQAFLHFDVTFDIDADQLPNFGWSYHTETISGLALNPSSLVTLHPLAKRYIDGASVRVVSVASVNAADGIHNVLMTGIYKDSFGDASTQTLTDGVSFTASGNIADITAITVVYRFFQPPLPFTVLQNGASTIISTLRILEAGNEIERIDEYGLLQRWLSYYHFHLEWMMSDGQVQGYYHDKLTGWKLNVSVAGSRTVKVNYCVPLWACGYFKQRYVPNPLMQEWQLEITLDSFANTVQTLPGGTSSPNGAVATNWTITNMELVIDILEPKPWYQLMIFEKRQMGSLFMMIDSVTHHSRNINGSNYTVILTDKMESISKILWGLRLSTDINNTATDSGIARSILDSANNVALKDYKYKLGSMTYPDQSVSHIKSINCQIPDGAVTGKTIEVDYHSYELSLSCARKFRMDHLNETTSQKTTFNSPNRFYGYTVNDLGSPVPWDDYSATNEPQACVIYTSFEKDKGYVSGANTEAANIDMQVQMNFTNSIQNTVTGEFFLFFNQAIKILNNGSTQKYK